MKSVFKIIFLSISLLSLIVIIFLVCARFSFVRSADMCHMHVRTMYVVSLCVRVFFLFCNRSTIEREGERVRVKKRVKDRKRTRSRERERKKEIIIHLLIKNFEFPKKCALKCSIDNKFVGK